VAGGAGAAGAAPDPSGTPAVVACGGSARTFRARASDKRTTAQVALARQQAASVGMALLPERPGRFRTKERDVTPRVARDLWSGAERVLIVSDESVA
jgi:hypothetical protein